MNANDIEDFIHSTFNSKTIQRPQKNDGVDMGSQKLEHVFIRYSPYIWSSLVPLDFIKPINIHIDQWGLYGSWGVSDMLPMDHQLPTRRISSFQF